MTFHHPSVWLLLLLLLLPLFWWRWASPRRRGAVAFSSIGVARRVHPSWAVRLRWVVPALRTAAIATLIVCLARPQKGDDRTRVITEGIAIQLIVDRSGSMEAMDFKIGGKRVTRLEAVKQVVERFVAGGDDLPGRPDDLIGLITFATWADSLCPLTLDHRHLIDAVRQTKISADEKDRGTSIGDAIALGVERMHWLDEVGETGDRPIKSRVIVLLTDGESNTGDIEPTLAARMAAAYDIKIYTIGAGTNQGRAPIQRLHPITGQRVTTTIPVSIDERTLQMIADTTGGRYFRATDSRSLERVYETIDELERTRIEQRRYTDYRELSVEPIAAGGRTLPPLLALVLILVAAETILTNTRFRRLP